MMWQKERPANDKAKPPAWLLGFFLLAVTFTAYQPVWHAGFVWDDNEFLRDNPVVKSADGWHQAWFGRVAHDFVPSTITSFWLEWHLWGANPLGYHLDNVLLHVCSAFLLWRILLRLKIPGAWLAAAIFALHPVNVESVAWISQRKNTLTMLFMLASVQCYLTFEDSGRRRWFWLAAGMFFLALMGKTAVVPLPVVLLGLAWWRRGRVEHKDIQHGLFLMALAAGGVLMAIWIQHGAAMGAVVRADSFWSRLAGAGWAVWFYLYKAVLPLNLAFVYPRWQIDPRNLLSYIPLVLLAAAFVLCWRSRQSWGKGLFFGLAYFVIMLLPILGFLNVYFMLFSLVNDHWEYFAIIGPIVLAAAVIRKPVVAAALLLALGALTWKQCGMYANDETLWQTTLRMNPDCWLAYNNLGSISGQEGKGDEAIAYFKKALAIKPDYVDARNNLNSALLQKAQSHYNLGLSCLQQGRMDDAIAQFRSAIANNPRYDIAFANLGITLARQGHLDEAMDQYRQALAIAPDNPYAHNALGSALETKNKLTEAAAQYSAAIASKPDFVEAHLSLARVLGQLGQTDAAIQHCRAVLRLNPQNVPALQKLAWLLATDPDPQFRNAPEALRLATQAAQLAPDDPSVWDAKAAGLAESGQYREAVNTAAKALDLAATRQKDLANQIQARLKLYQSGEPFHEPAHKQGAIVIPPSL